MQTIRVLLVDDHPALRLGLRVLLERDPSITVVDEVGDGALALSRIEALRPDVVILDCLLPGMEGAGVALELRRRGVPSRIVALSAYSDEKYVRAMAAAGAVGYLMKDEAPGSIVAAVHSAARGVGWFSPSAGSNPPQDNGRPHRPENLTAREGAVLELVAKGLSNREIARALSVSEKTVEFHMSNVMSKLGVGSRVEAALWALQNG